MADIKISQLGSLSSVGDANVLPIVAGGVTMKVTAQKLKEYAEADASTGIQATRNSIAPTESTSTASRAYAVGERLYYNGNFYKVTSAIAQDATLTVGTNIALAEDVTTQVRTLNNGRVLFYTAVPCSALTGNFLVKSDAAITADHVVTECVFANPSVITSDVTWTTAAGSLIFNGTCASATTATITLVKKDN